jgi:GTP-binding protein Era
MDKLTKFYHGLVRNQADGIDELVGGMGLGEIKRLLSLIRKQYDPLFAERKKICLVGPVNAGKSSLYNALVGRSSSKAEVSPVPGATRRPLTGDADVFWIIDTPGANEPVVGTERPIASVGRREEAIDSARRADLLIIVFDASRGIAQDELKMYDELRGLRKPAIVVLNKIDLVGKAQEDVLQSAALNLQLKREQIIPTSATEGTNVNRLLLTIVKTDPRLLATLSELAPGSRWLLANKTIFGASAAAGTANIMTDPVQIPFASFVPITAIQVGMVLSLARIFGFALSPGRAKEVIATFGSATLARTLFYQLVNLVPVAGWIVGTAIASATTMVLGYSVAAWFAYGERPSGEAVRKLSEEITPILMGSFRKLLSKRS